MGGLHQGIGQAATDLLPERSRTEQIRCTARRRKDGWIADGDRRTSDVGSVLCGRSGPGSIKPESAGGTSNCIRCTAPGRQPARKFSKPNGSNSNGTELGYEDVDCRPW